MAELRDMDHWERVESVLQGGQTERMHTMPHHGSYTTAQHQWGVATLIILLHPNPSARLIRAAILHDVGERYVGDVPSTIKWFGKHGPIARVEHAKAEEVALEKMGVLVYLDDHALNDEERRWLHACDMLEFLYWCRQQIQLGNLNVTGVTENAFHVLQLGFEEGRVPREVYEAAEMLNGRRTPDLHTLGKDTK